MRMIATSGKLKAVCSETNRQPSSRLITWNYLFEEPINIAKLRAVERKLIADFRVMDNLCGTFGQLLICDKLRRLST